MGRTFAFLVEYDLPDGVDVDQIFPSFMDTVRALDAPTPTMITAFIDDAAEAMIRARKGEP